MKYLILLMLISVSYAQDIQKPVIPAEQAAVYKEIMNLRNSNPEEALKKIAALEKPSAAFDLIKGTILQGQNKIAAAEKAFKEALGKLPGFYEARKQLAYLQLRQDRYKEALGNFLRVIQMGRADASIWQNTAACYIVLQKFQAAEEALRQLRLYNADDKQIDRTLLNIRLAQKDYEGALKISTQLVDSDPADRSSWKIMINTYIQLNKSKKALENMILFGSVFRLGNEERNLLAGLYFNEGLYKDAAYYYNTVDGTLENSARLQAASCYNYIGEFDNCLKTLAETAKYTPTEFARHHQLRAEAYTGQQKNEDALRELLQILKYDTLNSRVNFLIAQHYESKDREKAQDFYSRAAKDSAFTVVALMRSARLYAMDKNYSLAVSQAEKAVEAENSNRTRSFLQKIRKVAADK